MEELEDRFGDQMDGILNTVKASLQDPALNTAVNGQPAPQVDTVVYSEYQQDYDDAQQWEYDANEVIFDDHGEGVGIEGDLDVDDD